MKKISMLRKSSTIPALLARMGLRMWHRRNAFGLLLAGIAVFIAPFSLLIQAEEAGPLIRPTGAALAPQSSVLSSGQTDTGSGVAQPRVAQGPVFSTVPPARARRKGEAPEPEVPVPQGKLWAVIPASDNPPTEVASAGPMAANDMKFQVLHDISSSEVPASERSTVHEPSVGSMGNTIFMSANWYAARSTDAGNTFTYVSPYTTFPSINSGFCCDQIVNYARNQDMMIWALQYSKDASSGTLRIARAVGSAAVASNTWTYYDFDPQNDFGFPANTWMDFPNLTVSSNFLYCTSNMFDTQTNIFKGSVIWRIPLNELAVGGAINFNFLTRTDVGSLRCTEGATTTMYWAAFQNTSTLRIHRWDDSGGMVFWDNVGLEAFTFLRRDGIATSPDGTNWAGRCDSRVLGATVTGGVLAFMWGAKQDASFPFPYTVVGGFSQATRARLSQEEVWNAGFAWLYMNASVNSAENQAGMISFGGGSLYPNSAIWINDDVQSGFAPLNNFSAATSSDGPNDSAWGDYLTVRPHKDFANSWVGVTHYMTAGGEDEDTVGRYIWFGRERDLPQSGGGNDTIGVYRPSNTTFYLRNSNSPGFADLQIPYGAPNDVPIVGDWDGNGITTIGVYRPNDTTFYLRNSNSIGFADLQIPYGAPGDIPVVGDWDGNGTVTIAVYRPSNSTFYLRNSNTIGFADLQIPYGGPGDIPIAGDWDGNGTWTIGVFRPSNNTFFLRNSNSIGFADVTIPYGAPGDTALVGDWDGNGAVTIGIHRPSNNTFYLRNSNSIGFADLTVPYGTTGDKPLAGNWDGL